MMKIQMAVDLGFGDSGKGLCVDYLVSQAESTPLVVRFSGGHQVGHTVKIGSKQHTFSNFGAGTLRGAPTYYSEYCTVFPPAMLAELEHLTPLQPKLYLHPLVMITTPYDVAYNRAIESELQHGSCGVGFGTTVARHAQGVVLFAKDLDFPWILKRKLESVREYYAEKTRCHPALQKRYQAELENVQVQLFIDACAMSRALYEINMLDTLIADYTQLIFEGSQGIMLDQLHGLFPHVTPSNTTSRNAFELLDAIGLPASEPVSIYYLTRCYQTRHGNGPMSEIGAVSLINNETETNQTNAFQGAFRCAELDLELLDYALCSDAVYHRQYNVHKNMLVTCLDQHPEFQWHVLSELQCRYAIGSVYGSYGPTAEHIELLS